MHYYNLTFYTELTESTVLPAWKGSLLHGGFGRALKHHSDTLYAHIFEPKNSSARDLPRPFVIQSLASEKTHWSTGDRFTFKLNLFGSACAHLSAIIQAVLYWGHKKPEKGQAFGGLGRDHAGFSVHYITARLPNGTEHVIWHREQPELLGLSPMSLIDVIEATHQHYCPWLESVPESFNAGVMVTTHDILRLKHQGDICRSVPPSPIFIQTIQRRLRLLCQWFDSDAARTLTEFAPWLSMASSLPPLSLVDCTQWQTRTRLSSQTRTIQPQDGICGYWFWYGDIAPYLPWLALGELLHVGAKSSFGAGGFEWSTAVGVIG